MHAEDRTNIFGRGEPDKNVTRRAILKLGGALASAYAAAPVLTARGAQESCHSAAGS